MKPMEDLKVLNIPDLSGEAFRHIKASVDANDLAPYLMDRNYLRRVTANYNADEAIKIGDDQRDEFIGLGHDALHQLDTLDDTEVSVLLALLQGIALAENADGLCPCCIWDDFIGVVYGENSDHAGKKGCAA